MKIGIDTFGCSHGRSGLGSFLLSLIENLPEKEGVEYELFGAEMDRFTYVLDSERKFTSVNVPDSLAAERIWHRFRANKFAKKNKYDAVFYTAATSMLPLHFKVPSVAFVNEIITNKFKSGDLINVSQTKKSLSCIDTIIASSEYVKQDLIDFGVKSDIQVVQSGVNHSLFYPKEGVDEKADVLEIKPFAIKRPYLIYASKLQDSSKKHVELIKAFTIFKEKTHLPHRLVIAGSEGPYGEEVHKAAFASSAASDIFITGYFPHESFAELYRYADACIFPSVNEGAGLSVMEAMASGVPVACSSSGALPEIAKDGALYFDSDNISQVAECIEQILTDSYLRETLVNKSIEITKDYSCEDSVKKMMEIVEDTAKKRVK